MRSACILGSKHTAEVITRLGLDRTHLRATRVLLLVVRPAERGATGGRQGARDA